MLNIGSHLKNIQKAEKSIEENKNILITGATETAGMIMLSHFFAKFPKTYVLVCKDGETAEKIYDTFSYYGTDRDSIYFYPEAENYIYRDLKPIASLTGERLAALSALGDGKPKIVITSPQAIAGRVMPPSVLKDSIVSVRVGDETDINEFEAKLLAIGYAKGQVCDRKGIYSKRGSLIDVYPSNEEHPVRITLDWDEISEIKYFDTETQRSEGNAERIFITPAREVFASPKLNTDNIKKALRDALLSENEYSDRLKKNTEYDIERLEESIFFGEADYYLPYLHEECYFADYLPKDAVMVFSDPAQICSSFDNFLKLTEKQAAENIKNGHLVSPEFSPVYRGDDFFLKFTSSFVSVGLCRSEGSDSIFSSCVNRTDINSEDLSDYTDRFRSLMNNVRGLAKTEKTVFATASAGRMEQILRDYDIEAHIVDSDTDIMSLPQNIFIVQAPIPSGAVFKSIGLRIWTDREVFGRSRAKKARRLQKDTQTVKSYLDLKKGDLAVHEDYGICKYKGVERKTVNEQESDYLALEFKNNTLYISVNALDRIRKYVAPDGTVPHLSSLGTGEWAKTKAKAKKKIFEIAKELVRLYAWRKDAKGFACGEDTEWQKELEQSFPYRETRSQLITINEIKRDLESETPMDRLVCGDVGYGKTEVAIRAAFKVAMEGRQVALLAPTTVLSQQHYYSFKERLAPFPQKIELLNRFRTAKEIKESVENIKNGTAGIIIGTHRILSKDVTFSNLGLVIIDEEQRFGVKHKEKLKEMRKAVDVLSLSATPIPRTLNMSLSGIRSISLITDPPEGRIPIRTYVRPYDINSVAKAISFELSRGGQVFFVHNRVEDINEIADEIEEACPEAIVDIGHGKMRETELEEVMMDFYEGRVNVLVATTIIENGIDVPNANTIIIDNADRLGLAQLYQLRGRVGRSGRQAYAYLLYRDNVTETGDKRLNTLIEFSELGSGYRIAEKDLEIRGAGNLLGKEQSGSIEGIGFDYFCSLLNEEVMKLKGEQKEKPPLPSVGIKVNTYIPEDYIEEESLRIMFYKKLTMAESIQSLANIKNEIEDRFGRMPQPCRNMFDIMEIRLAADSLNIAEIGPFKDKFYMSFRPSVRFSRKDAERLSRIYDNMEFAADRIFYYAPSAEIIKYTFETLEKIRNIK